MAEVTKDILRNDLRKLVAEITEIDEEKILPEAKFVEDLGMDSMMALEILASIEKQFKVKIPEENMATMINLNNTVTFVESLLAEKK